MIDDNGDDNDGDGDERFIICLSMFNYLQDWDGNGTIDFAEFLYSFASWVDIDDDDDDDEDGDH
jgi:hypothetical protein